MNTQSPIMRWNIINHLIREHNCRSYLEIGYQSGICFEAIKCPMKIAVDPAPLKKYANDGVLLIESSDQYFQKSPAQMDCVFIDGLHHADQVARDINNAWNIARASVIVVHDCLPPSAEVAMVPRQTKEWFGDVFRCVGPAIQLQFEIPGVNVWVDPADCGCMVITIDRGNPATNHNINLEPGRYNWDQFQSQINWQLHNTIQ